MPALNALVRRLLPRSLVGRVYALYAATLMLFVLLGLSAFYRYQFSIELEDAHVRAESLVAVVAPTVADNAVIGDYDTIRRTLESAIYHSNFASATFIDLKGGKVQALRGDPPDVQPPAWLRDKIAAQLFDTNQPITAGGRDYGILRLSFAADRIAGELWRLSRYAMGLAVLGLVGGLAFIRIPLVRWLGNLDRIRAFEEGMRAGHVDQSLALADDAPIEFRRTFAALARAAASLQAQREQAAVTLTAIADAVFTLDADGRILLANPAACAVVEQTAEALAHRAMAEVMPEVFDGQSDLLAWQDRRCEVATPTQHLVLESTLSIILAPSGQAAGYVLACRDVTQQHNLDQRLRVANAARESALTSLRGLLEGLKLHADNVPPRGDDIAAISALIATLVARLQERGAQLTAIVELSPDGFVSFDAHHRVSYVGPAFFKLTGLPASQVMGLDEVAFCEMLTAQCDTAQTPPFQLGLMRVEDGDGARRARRMLIELVRPTRRVLEVALRQGSNSAISQALYLRDVTHETEVDQMKTEFLSTAAHELRTPMTSIFGFSELMLSRQLSQKRQTEVIETIHRQTARMITIVNELLDLQRIEARRGKDFTLETVDLVALVRAVAGDLQTPDQRDPPVLFAPADVPWVRIDRNKMTQAVVNVLSNAYKYSPAGGSVTVAFIREGASRVGLQIRDQGIGLTPSQLVRVSERFYRADASGNIPGTGLGMSIVKEIVELLGGTLQLDSQVGQGTTVTLWLPLATPPAVADEPIEAVAAF